MLGKELPADLYSKGLSFDNPRVPGRGVAFRKAHFMRWGKVGTTPRKDMTQWRRRAKAEYTNKAMIEVPSFNELGFGETPIDLIGPIQPSQARDSSGFLSSLITTVGSIVMTAEERKLAEARAKLSVYQRPTGTGTDIIGNLPWILGIGGGGLLLAMFLLKRR